MRLYIDTNVYLDYLLKRRNKRGRDISHPAFDIFLRAISCEFYIVVSDAVLNEMRKHVEPARVSVLFNMLQEKSYHIEANPDDKELAKRIPSNDAIHIVLARRAEAIVVTRNISDFVGFVDAKLPEDV